MFGCQNRMLPLLSAGMITLFAGINSFKEKKVISARLIDKNIAKVTDSLYAYKYETANWEYNSFLSAIQQTNPDLYLKCCPDTLGWRSILSYCEPPVEYYHRHPAYDNYPVVNVSYEAAQVYCQWLTDRYNADSKRKFKKVLFTLPTTVEWVQAARGGKKNPMFPWGNFYVRNNKGMFLANFKRMYECYVVSDKQGNPVLTDSLLYVAGSLNDRAFYTSEVKAFYPNGFGLYNMSGNVAEMTTDKGVGKGGCFNSYGGEIRIDAIKHYDGSSPELGFRVFMKILEN